MSEQYRDLVVSPVLHGRAVPPDVEASREWVYTEMMDREDCEDAVPPAISGEVAVYESSATFARSSDQAHAGTYSYKLTKTVAAGSSGYVSLQDNVLTNDMHGLEENEVLTLSVWLYLPSGVVSASEILVRLYDYMGSWAYDATSPTAVYDEWQQVSVSRTLRDGCTGFRSLLLVNTGEDNGDYLYVDDVSLHVEGRGYWNDIPATVADVDMIEVQFTPRMRQTWERHHNCAICTYTFPEAEMIEVNGSWYCTRYHHDREADTTSGIQRSST